MNKFSNEPNAAPKRGIGLDISAPSVIFCAYIVFSQVGANPFGEQALSTLNTSGDIVNQIVIVALSAFLFAFSLSDKRGRKEDVRDLWLTFLVVYCLVSVIWAVDFSTSIRRVGLTILNILIIFKSLSILGPVRMLSCLRYIAVIFLIMNYAFVFFTDHGTHAFIIGDDGSIFGAWRGILPHKNIAGPISALSAIIFIFYGFHDKKYINVFIISLEIIFLIFSNSRTSMGAFLFSLAMGFLYYGVNGFGDGRLFKTSRVIAVAFFVMFSLNVVIVFDLFSSNPLDVNGRNAIWNDLVNYARDHIWLGSGFGSFWQIGDKSPIWEYDNGWVARIAAGGHNGFLDLLVTIGLPGFCLGVFTLFVRPLRALLTGVPLPKPIAALTMAILAFVFAHNMGESQLMDRAAFDQEMLIIALALIAYARPRMATSWMAAVTRRYKP